MSAILAAGFAVQNASAGVLFTNQVKNIQAMCVRPTLAADGSVVGVSYYSHDGKIRNEYVPGTGGATGKAWIQFHLSSIWAQYGETNLANATLTLWNQNGTSRPFWVVGVADSAGLEGWVSTNLTWTNAPANDYYNLATMGYGFDYSKCYAHTNVWEVTHDAAEGIDVSTAGNTQGALYISTNSTSLVTPFLKTDTDGLVTFGICNGPANYNETIPIGTNGYYDGEPLAANGLPTKDSPTLTLVFDVRVALTGGGNICPGDPGADVSLAGSDTGMDYLLYTNGVYSGQTVSGTGSAIDFGLQSVPATYTAVASNVTTTATTLLPGTAVVAYVSAPVITTQPASVFAATNSLAIFTLIADAPEATYQWYLGGTPLSDNGHYTGTTTSQLIIAPVLASDAATTANGYYCVISNVCGVAVASTTNALTIQNARSLVWIGTPSNIWDVATTMSWSNTASHAMTVFDSGDNVTLDDNAQNTTVELGSPYLAPGVITYGGSGQMIIDNAIGAADGDISGQNSSLVVGGTLSATLTINNPNSYGGGTTINDGWLTINNNGALGTNAITMAGTGYSVLEVVPAGSAGYGIPGVNVTADSTLQFDHNGAYAGVIVGPMTGTAGKTLTVQDAGIAPGDNIRLYGEFTCDNNIVLDINGANWAPYQSGTAIYNGVISGNGVLYPRHGETILNGANTFNQTVISQGDVGVGIDSALPTSSPLGLGTLIQDNQGDQGIFAVGGARTIQNPFTWLYRGDNNRIFKLLGTNQLTMSGQFDLSGGTNGVTRTIEVDNTAPSILSGVVTDSGQNCGIDKTGDGTLYLNNGANSYSGTTTIGAGVLAGSGNIPGSLVVTGGGVGGGSTSAIGTLSVGGNVTFNGGGAFIRVNKSLSPAQSNDTVSVTGTLSCSAAGTVTVTNLGPALQTGDRFMLFGGKTVSGGSSLTVTGGGMLWTNKLALDGSIQVIGVLPPPVNPNPTNIVVNVANGVLNLSWPADHTGWTLQAQTNSLATGLSTNWTTIGYQNTNSVSIPINSANPTVFYRLFYQP